VKDTVITASRKKKELFAILVCFILASIFNFSGILIYNTNWKELYTQIPLVLLITVFFYGMYWLIRFLVFGVGKLVKRPR
jgi:hypothetical protein